MTENGRQRGPLSETLHKELRVEGLQRPVTALLADREVNLIPGRDAEAVRHAVVLGMGLGPPGRWAGDAPPLPAYDAWLD